MDIFKLFGTIAINNDEAIQAIDDTNGKAEKLASSLSSKFQSAGTAIGSVGKALMPVSATAAAALGASTKGASDFTDGMAKMSTLFDTTQTDVGDLSKKFLSLSNDVNKSGTELADAGYQALSAGISVENSVGFVNTAARLSKAGFTATSTAVDVLTTSINAYGLEQDQAESISNKLVRTQNLGKTTVDELAASMGKIIPTASSMNVDINNLTSGYVALTKQGTSTAESTTYMNSMLNELGKSSSITGKILKQQTGKSFQELMESGMSLADVLQITKDYAEQTGTNFNELWGSAEAGKAGIAILNGGVEEFNQTVETMNSDVDDVGIALEKLNTPSERVKKALNQVKNSGIELGTAFMASLAPTLEKVVDGVSKATEWFSELDEDTKSFIATALAIVAAVAPVALAISKITGTVTDLISSFGTFSTALGGLSPPVMAAVGIIGVLIGAIVYLWNTNEDFRNAITIIWNGIKNIISTFVDTFKQKLADIGITFESVTSAILTVWNGFCTVLAPLLEGAFSALASILEGALDVILGIVDVFVGLFTGNWEQLGEGLKEIISGIWETVEQLFILALDTIIDTVEAFCSLFGTTWDEVWTGVKTTVENIWNAITATINGAIDMIMAVLQGIPLGIGLLFDTVISALSIALEAITFAISTALDAIWLVITTIFNAIISFLSVIWNGILTIITTVLNAIYSIVMAIWNAVSSFISSILNTISNIIHSAWNLIRTTITTVVNGIRNVIQSVFSAISSIISSIMNTIKTVFTTVWNAIKTTVSTVVNGIKSTISSGLNAASSTVSSVLNAIRSKFDSIMNAAANIVSSAINKIKGFFNFSWSLPPIKLPHFSISGKFSLNPPSIPSFGVSWYKKAMDEPYMFTKPTIFDVNPATGTAKGAGEAGDEVMIGKDTMLNMIRMAVSDENVSLLEVLTNILRILQQFMPYMPKLANMQLVTDTGVLVGELATQVDEALGEIEGHKDRGV